MKILICNDDGPPCPKESPFILPFVEHLESLGWDVRVCLPNSQKSWIAKSFMITEEIQLLYYNRKTMTIHDKKQEDNDFYLLTGTPATCVNIALNHLFQDQEFDLVITGPNFGRNISNIFTLASGTVGAAMEAVLNNRKAISFSFCFCNQKPECIQNGCETASDIIQHLYSIDSPWPKNGLFNVNIPMTDYRCPVQLTEFHQTTYGSLFKPLDKSGTRFKFSPTDSSVSANNDDAEPGTDKWAVFHKYVSVTPVVTSFQTAAVKNLDYNFDAINQIHIIKE